MTLTFPVDLPAGKLLECSFDLLDPIAMVRSGRSQKVNLAQVEDPIWRATIRTSNLERSQRAAWRAWRKSLKGGLNFFYAWDLARRAPLAYWSATNAGDILANWDGSATVAALSASGDLQLSGLPAGYEITADDPIGLVEATVRGYFSALESVTASGAGTATVQIAPAEHFGAFTTAASAQLWRPVAMFTIDGDSWTLPEIDGLSAASFTATQRLY